MGGGRLGWPSSSGVLDPRWVGCRGLELWSRGCTPSFSSFAPPVRKGGLTIRPSNKSALGAFASPQVLKIKIVVDLREKHGF